jgi:phospholipid N-methyltransferase
MTKIVDRRKQKAVLTSVPVSEDLETIELTEEVTHVQSDENLIEDVQVDLENQFGEVLEKVFDAIFSRAKLMGVRMDERNVMALQQSVIDIFTNKLVFGALRASGVTNINEVISPEDIKSIMDSVKFAPQRIGKNEKIN